MKKIKCIIVLFTFVILSGCVAKVDITVNKDGTVSENAKILTETKNISNKKDRVKSYLNTAIDNYKNVLDIRKYKYDLILKEDDYSGASFSNSFDNVCDYINNTLLSQYLYKKVSCIESDYYYEIRNVSEHIPYCAECSSWPSIENVKLNIRLPFEAAENDADEVKDNIYTWKFNENTSDNKSFYLKINKQKLEEEHKKAEIKKNIVNKSKNIVIILIIVGGIIFIGSILYKKYKNNKIEY